MTPSHLHRQRESENHGDRCPLPDKATGPCHRLTSQPDSAFS